MTTCHTTSCSLPEPELNTWVRLYIYGIHGFLIEIFFTAAWEFALHRDWALTGCTNIWSLFIYGVGGFVGEKFYRRYHESIPFLLRGLVYVAWIYVWEYTTGRILRMYNACPWDYKERRYNLHGLITLEYFPAWYTVSLFTEQLVIHNVLYLSLSSLDNHNRLTQKG